MQINFNTLALVVLICYLVFNRSQDKVMPLKKLLFLPGLSLYFLYDSLTTHFSLNATDMAVLAVGLLLGAGIGYGVMSAVQVRADKEQLLLFIKGSWTAAGMFVVILAAKIGIGYFMQINPYIGMQFSTVQLLLVLIASTASGLPAGQSLVYYSKYQAAASEHLEAPTK